MAIKLCKAIWVLGCAMHCYAGVAQTQTEAAKNINAVKRDTMYLYAEATMGELEEACYAAKAILEVKVGDWVREQHPQEDIEVCIVKAKEHYTQLETRRGDFYRAFVYVSKNDIFPIADRSEVTIFEVPAETKPVLSEDAPLTSVAETTLTPEEEQMKAVRDFYAIEPYIKRLQEKGLLQDYGKYATLPATGSCHLFVYDRQGNIAAFIRREESGKQVNLNTLKDDDVKNYNNCGAIWLRLK